MFCALSTTIVMLTADPRQCADQPPRNPLIAHLIPRAFRPSPHAKPADEEEESLLAAALQQRLLLRIKTQKYYKNNVYP
jgi:hypothetical protein